MLHIVCLFQNDFYNNVNGLSLNHCVYVYVMCVCVCVEGSQKCL